MKKCLLTAMAVCCSLMLMSQEEMSQDWATELDHKIIFSGTGLEGEVSYVANDKEMTVFNNADGKIIWTKPFKELAPKLRKIDELIPFWKSDCIFLFEKKGGKDQIAVIDLHTGQLLWNTEKYQDLSEDNIVYIEEEDGFAISLKKSLIFIKAKTGEEIWETEKFKGVVGKYIYGNGYITTLNFVPGGLAALFTGFKNQIAKINLKNGDIVWESTYIGRAERKVISKEFIYDLRLEGDKLFLFLNGIQVYDHNTGAHLWSAAYEETPKVVGAPANAKAFGVYHAVADPVISGNDIYVIEMTKKSNQKIKKYDLNTGKLLWTSPEIKKAKALPNMYVVDDKVIVQVGGVVEAQAYIYKRETGTDGSVTITEEWRIWYPNIKPNGLQAFNTSDGSLAWTSERFKKGITNIFTDEQLIYVCSGKALYALDYKSGDEKYEVNIMGDGVGNAIQILNHQDVIAMVGEKGIATHKKSDGSLVNSGKYKKSELKKRVDNIVLMETPNADIAAFDLNTCKFLEFNAKKDARSFLSEDGGFVYVYQKKDVYKLKTH